VARNFEVLFEIWKNREILGRNFRLIRSEQRAENPGFLPGFFLREFELMQNQN
jgi:hypothetical protein